MAREEAKSAVEDNLLTTILLRDSALEVVEAWRRSFEAHCTIVHVSQGDLFEDAPPVDAVVAAGNSFGYFTGGVDRVIAYHFGWEVQQKVQAVIRSEHDGELPVGDALIFRTEKPDVPFLIVAPVMRVPTDVSCTVNAFLAFRAVLRAIYRHNASGKPPITRVMCPGMGTGMGRMSPERSAAQMLKAFEVLHLHRGREVRAPRSLEEAVQGHAQLLGSEVEPSSGRALTRRPSVGW